MQQKRLGPANPVAFYATLILFVLFAGYMVLKQHIGYIDVKPGELVCIKSEAQKEGWHFYLKKNKVKKISSVGTFTRELNATTKNGRWKLDLNMNIKYNIRRNFDNMCDGDVNDKYIQDIIVRDIANGIMNDKIFRRLGILELNHIDISAFTNRLIVILPESKAKATITRIRKGKK